MPVFFNTRSITPPTATRTVIYPNRDIDFTEGGTFAERDHTHPSGAHTHVAADITDFDVEVANNAAVVLNTAKTGGTPTALSTGTITATTYGITSDGGADDVILLEANTNDAGLLGADKWDEIVLNTAKITNIPTNLSEGAVTNTTVDIDSSDGTNATLAEASTTRAGLLGKAKWDEIVANTSKAAGVPTVLSIGTVTAISFGITSDGSADDVILPEANTNDAGLLGADKWDEIVLNTAKIPLTDGDKTDITVSASGATWTIDPDVVTYAKIQNVVADNVLLGNNSGAGGVVDELTVTEVNSLLGTNDGTILKTFTAGETVAVGDICYFKSDGKMWKSDASASATGKGLIAMANAAITVGNPGEFMLRGEYTTTGLTVAGEYFMSETAAAITVTIPVTGSSIVRLIGYALSATILLFDPDKSWYEN